VRRLLVLSAAGGLKLHERIEAILAGLPNVDWQSAHTLADELAATSAEQKFEIFFDLLLRRIAGEARRLGASGAVWAELWEWIVREKEQVLTLNLDRRMLILDAVSRLAALARS
jgi:DNA polymerase-3 subunit delta'